MRIKCYTNTVLLTLGDGYTILFEPKRLKYVELNFDQKTRQNDLILTFDDDKIVSGHQIGQLHFYKLLAIIQKFKADEENGKEIVDNEGEKD